MEQIESQLESTSEPVSILFVLLTATTTDLTMINPSSPTIIVELTSSTAVTDPASSVASMLVYVETSRLTVSSAPLMTALVTPLTITTTKPMETSFGITCSLGVIEVEKVCGGASR